uniref:Coiled-coil domain-containing protein 39 n=1 Tax=Erpetoichthys calabaricus TaxID=27687 RepID=A0A8C4SKZ7_ERPCA
MASTILSQLGWDEGFAIPVANTENKTLEEELKKKQAENAQLENKMSEFEDRISAMSEHLKNVRQELNHTQAVCRAREKEVESEMHFKALAEREMGRLRQEIQRLENELIAMREKRNVQENNIFKVNQKLEKLKNQLNWDQQALEAWLEESARKDEDAMTIIKYAKQDEGKIRELTLQIEKMTSDANQKRKLLDNELTETITAQIELDKTAEDFRRAHTERENLIQQWESTIEQMRKRDQQMDQCSLWLAEVKQEIRQKEVVINEKLQFLENEVQNNKEYEKKISTAERQAAKLRLDFKDQERNRSQLQSELESLKGTVDRTATDLETMRAQVTNLKKDIVDKNKHLETAKENNSALLHKLKTVNESTLSAEERSIRMEEALKEMEQSIKDIENQFKHLKELQFKRAQELQSQKVKEKNILSEIAGGRAALQNLNSRLNKLDRDSIQQQQLIYSQDFKIQQLERKLGRLKGDVNTEERQAIEAKVTELTNTLEEKKATSNLLTTQLKKLQDDVRFVKKELEKTGSEKNDLDTKNQELNLFIEISGKELKKIKQNKQDSMVDINIVKLHIKRLRDLLYSKADHVLSLEKRKLQLQNAMKERAEDIKVHQEMLQTQLRLVDQERQGLSAELHDRLSKIDKLRKRYEIIMVSMAPPEGEEDKSQAFYVIKAAQEKEELQREGDELDAKIRKAEKEIRALENTLHVINSRNSTYRKSFNKVTETSEEYEEKLKLEEQKRAVEEKYKYKKRQIRELQEDTKVVFFFLTMRNILYIHYPYLKAKCLKCIKRLLTPLSFCNQCAKLAREIQSAKHSGTEIPAEQDIRLRELRDFNKSINKLLVEAMADHSDLSSILQIYFQQAQLPLPTSISTPGSRQSSRLSSSRSSISSGRLVQDPQIALTR